MKDALVVVHCFRYSRALTWQLSSLVLFPPTRVHLRYLLYTTADDAGTHRVSDWFRPHLEAAGIALDVRDQPLGHLLQRTIGRNEAAQTSTHDILWFADADGIFRQGALDALADLPLDPTEPGYSPLYYPQITLYNHTKESGDEYSRRAAEPAILDIDEKDFVEHRPRKATGGAQIVPGAVARQHGYCRSHLRLLKPFTGTTWNHNTRGDVVFRQDLGTNGKAWPIPNVHRIRQSIPGKVDA